MTIYKPRKSSFYHYDFVLKGKRFTGSTGQRLVKAARRVEDDLREKAKLGLLDDAAQYTADVAVGRWWCEKGQSTAGGRRPRPDKLSPLEMRLDRLLDIVGRSTRLAEIDQAAVAGYVEARRRKATKRSKATGAKAYLPANATVNRDVISLLRPVLRRARTHWGAKGLPEINWGDLALEQPRESVRVYGSDEEVRWLDECRRTGWYRGKTPREDAADISLALELVLTYGLRLGELMFPPAALGLDASGSPVISWLKGRKRDVPHQVTLLPHHAREVTARAGRAQAAKLAHIWFYEKRNGDLVPIPAAGLQRRINNAADRAGVAPGRRIHGGRHHAGTLFYAHTRDLKLTQQLLGHLDPASTLRYVHADKAGVRRALEAMNSQNNPGPTKDRERKPK